MKLLCRIFGCRLEELAPGCRRCRAYLYDWDFIQREQAWLSPWYSFVWWLWCNRYWFWHRCDVCNKPMMFTKNHCCSEECYDQWIPF